MILAVFLSALMAAPEFALLKLHNTRKEAVTVQINKVVFNIEPGSTKLIIIAPGKFAYKINKRRVAYAVANASSIMQIVLDPLPPPKEVKLPKPKKKKKKLPRMRR